jgi:hypothetical protein
MCNAEKKEPRALQFFWIFAGVLLAHLFCKGSNFEFDNQASKVSIRLFQMRV